MPIWRAICFCLEYTAAIWHAFFSAIVIQRFNSNTCRAFMLFTKTAITQPGMVGAVLPSSRRLARKMASYVCAASDEWVVELGPGTGVITQALLERGVNPRRLIAIEFDAKLAAQLRQRFPEIIVLQGDAANIKALLQPYTQQVKAIVSGLPLRSLPTTMVNAIVSAMPLVLAEQGQYIQFTYDIRKHDNFYPDNYQCQASSIVCWNVPPAKVSCYRLVSLL